MPMTYEQRKAYRARLEAHYERERQFAAERAGTGQPDAKADRTPYEDKRDRSPYEDKAAAPENKLDEAELDGLTKSELRRLAHERGVGVTRSDGRTDLSPRVSDYVTALTA